MTWLSRLLPQSPRLPRLADHNNRTRQAQRRRRMSTLETLEGRTLLSNVTTLVAHSAANGLNTLTITGDTHNDEFSVTANSNGTVTLVGTPTNPLLPKLISTQINSLKVGVSYTTTQAISVINVILPGTYPDTDSISMTGKGSLASVTINVQPGGTTTPSVIEGPELLLSVNALTVSGAFTVNDANTTATSVGGLLVATVDNSNFGSLSIAQTGCCNANVELGNDTVPGSVTVNEGRAPNDVIRLDAPAVGAALVGPGDHFGATVLKQYTGTLMPASSNNWGDGDEIYVDYAQLYDLTTSQGNGVDQSLDVGNSPVAGALVPDDVELSLTGFGLNATQGDSSSPTLATTPGATAPYPGAPLYSPDTIVIQSITMYGKVSNSMVLGPPNITTKQGNGASDSTTIDSSTVAGNISAFQGNGAGDLVHLADDVAGWTVPNGPYYTTDMYGFVFISQGNGYNDSVVVDSNGSEPGVNPINSFNTLVILQGNSSLGIPVDCTEPLGDVVSIDQAAITSDLIIIQNSTSTSTDGTNLDLPGATFTDGTGIGANVVSIGSNVSVTVGEWTRIFQGGANNTVVLGGASGYDSGLTDFETTYLDIWTGALGGGTVYAANTTVDVGSLPAPGPGNDYVIDGGADGNTYVDLDGNSIGGASGPLTYNTNHYSG